LIAFVSLAACTVVNSSNDAAAPSDGSTDESNTSDSSAGDSGPSGDTTGGEPTGDDTAGGGDTTVSVDDACAAWAKNECALSSSCTPFDLAYAYGDATTCEARTKLLCLAKAAAPGIGSDFASSLKKCSTLTPACADFRNGVRDASCSPHGTVAKDGVCGVSEQCAAGLGCSIDSGSTCGTCLAIGKDGDPCQQVGVENFFCGPGTYCPSKGTTCVAIPAEGGACTFSGPAAICNAVDYCDATTKCVPNLATEGATCDPSLAFGGGGCDRSLGLTCDATAKTCAKIVTASAGSACDGATTCLGGSACSSSVCTGPVTDGSDCSTMSNCLAPATCDRTTTKCTLPSYTTCK
jgi:hypothetical protein